MVCWLLFSGSSINSAIVRKVIMIVVNKGRLWIQGEFRRTAREWSASDDDETTRKLLGVVYKKLYGVVAVKTHYPLLGSGGEKSVRSWWERVRWEQHS